MSTINLETLPTHEFGQAIAKLIESRELPSNLYDIVSERVGSAVVTLLANSEAMLTVDFQGNGSSEVTIYQINEEVEVVLIGSIDYNVPDKGLSVSISYPNPDLVSTISTSVKSDIRYLLEALEMEVLVYHGYEVLI